MAQERKVVTVLFCDLVGFTSRAEEMDPEAANLLDEIGDLPLAAYVRLQAAERFASEGRKREAQRQIERGLAFYRAVGATRYLRQGEALLAAAS
jgi:hypothetical protein